ncbi:MAG: hypothetical protein L0G99_10825 [Propionibacteriales bacterium]|nr:hypothetical protein [Propionibacteriales bacterium]
MTESPGGPANRGPELFEASETREPTEGVLELREAQPAFVLLAAVEHWTGREVRHVSGPWERLEGRGLRGRGGQGNRDA